MTVRTLARRDRAFPRPFKVGQQHRWDPDEIEAWLETTREPPPRVVRRAAEPACRPRRR